MLRQGLLPLKAGKTNGLRMLFSFFPIRRGCIATIRSEGGGECSEQRPEQPSSKSAGRGGVGERGLCPSPSPSLAWPRHRYRWKDKVPPESGGPTSKPSLTRRPLMSK